MSHSTLAFIVVICGYLSNKQKTIHLLTNSQQRTSLSRGRPADVKTPNSIRDAAHNGMLEYISHFSTIVFAS